MNNEKVYQALASLLPRPAKLGELMTLTGANRTTIANSLRRLIAAGRVLSVPIPLSPFAQGGAPHRTYQAVKS